MLMRQYQQANKESKLLQTRGDAVQLGSRLVTHVHYSINLAREEEEVTGRAVIKTCQDFRWTVNCLILLNTLPKLIWSVRTHFNVQQV